MAEKIKIEPSYYAIIPADVRYAAIIPNAKLMYGEITALCGKDGYCWATNKYFSDLYNVAPTTVSEWVNLLLKYGFITVEISDKTHRKIFLTLREKPKGGTGKAEGYPSGKAEANNTSINIKNNKSFLDFWNLYPKKVEKKKTESKWNRLNKITRDLIMADLPRRKKSQQWQKGFILNPMTYLNGERWNDQIIEPPKVNNNQNFSLGLKTTAEETKKNLERLMQ